MVIKLVLINRSDYLNDKQFQKFNRSFITDCVKMFNKYSTIVITD